MKLPSVDTLGTLVHDNRIYGLSPENCIITEHADLTATLDVLPRETKRVGAPNQRPTARDVVRKLKTANASVTDIVYYSSPKKVDPSDILPNLRSFRGTSSEHLIRREISSFLRTAGKPDRTNPLWCQPTIKAARAKPLSLHTAEIVRADPNFNNIDYKDTKLMRATTPINVRRFAETHFHHCDTCAAHLQQLDDLTAVSDDVFFRRIFNVFDANCYASHLYGGLAFGFEPLLTEPIPRFSYDNYREVLLVENRPALIKAWEKQLAVPGVFEPGCPNHVNPLVLATRTCDELLARVHGTVPKRRLCLDLSREVNDRCERYEFRYTDAQHILKHIHNGDYVAMLDLRSYFLTLPLSAKFRKYCSLKCPRTGKILQYKNSLYSYHIHPQSIT